MGRREMYSELIQPKLEYITEQIKLGQVEGKIHRDLGVSHQTWNEYKNKYPELVDAIKAGKQDICSQLQQTLYTIANGGYIYTDQVANSKGEAVDVEKTLPPNVSALLFALKNHMPDFYKDKRDLEVSGGLEVKGFNRFFVDSELEEEGNTEEEE